MKKPLLVTLLTDNVIEVLTDYKLEIKQASTPSGPLSVLRVESEPGLIGTVWHLERAIPFSPDETLSILASRSLEEEAHAFYFKL